MGLHEFTWIIKGEVAAMAMPDGTEADWRGLRRRGVEAVVNLTRRRWPGQRPEGAGLAYLRIPVDDFSAPTMEQVRRFVDFCVRQRAAQRAIAVHCMAGRGRTGTMIACYLTSAGMDADQAMSYVRRMRPGSIETAGQEAAVREWARLTGGEQA